ncbi:MAG TPA: hypothetical protein VM689_23420 [Aliidongia sp.]|nr:hypothetical protein [Aliidongia sp.]
MATGPDLSSIRWLDAEGQPVSCVEKLKVLTETLAELRQISQDAFEDALLMGCAEPQIRQVLEEIARSLDNPYRKRS